MTGIYIDFESKRTPLTPSDTKKIRRGSNTTSTSENTIENTWAGFSYRQSNSRQQVKSEQAYLALTKFLFNLKLNDRLILSSSDKLISTPWGTQAGKTTSKFSIGEIVFTA